MPVPLSSEPAPVFLVLPLNAPASFWHSSLCSLLSACPSEPRGSHLLPCNVHPRLPWAVGDQEDTPSFDLFSISNINRKTIGAKQFRGPEPGTPAYRFVRFDYIPPVGADALRQLVAAMQRKDGFFLSASLRQDGASRGTLLALEGPGATQRQFDLVSNGPDDRLDLTYWLDGRPHLLALEDVGLADGQWKNVTVQVAGDAFSLYVGCDLIDSVRLEQPFYEQLVTDQARMYVVKGASRESHFRVCRGSHACARRGTANMRGGRAPQGM